MFDPQLAESDETFMEYYLEVGGEAASVDLEKVYLYCYIELFLNKNAPSAETERVGHTRRIRACVPPIIDHLL